MFIGFLNCVFFIGFLGYVIFIGFFSRLHIGTPA